MRALVVILILVISFAALWWWRSLGGTSSPGPGGDFSITVSKSTMQVSHAAGSSDTATVTITPLNGFNALVHLSFSCSPPQPMVSGSFSPDPTGPGFSQPWISRLRVGLASAASPPAGTYSCSVTGTSSPIEHSVGVTLNVVD